MKKRITLTLNNDTIKLLKKMAKARDFTVSQLVEGIFLSVVADEETNNPTSTNK
jgi:predicted DNA-binding ribbon-helix-helix protein